MMGLASVLRSGSLEIETSAASTQRRGTRPNDQLRSVDSDQLKCLLGPGTRPRVVVGPVAPMLCDNFYALLYR
jgi:hypothetical protein